MKPFPIEQPIKLYEVNGVTGWSFVSKDRKVISTIDETETGKTVFRSVSIVDDGGATMTDFIDFDFWEFEIDGEKVTADDFKNLVGGGPYSLWASANERIIRLATKSALKKAQN